MFTFFKRLSYNKKDLKALSEIIIKNDKDFLAKEIFLNKIYHKHNELKTSFENNQIFEYAKFLNIFFNKENNTNIPRIFLKINKKPIEEFLEKNFQELNKNKNSFRYDFLIFNVLKYYFEDSKITLKIYKSFIKDILNNEDSNLKKIKDIADFFELIRFKNIIKELFTRELNTMLKKTREDILNNNISLTIQDIDVFKEFNKHLYYKSYNRENILVDKIDLIDFYDKIDFSKIDKRDYIHLLSNKKISEKLFNNIIQNIEINNKNVKQVYNAIKNLDYKSNHQELFDNLKKEVDNIKSKNNKTLLTTSLLVGALAASSNSSNNDSSLLEDVVSVGIDIGIGYGISEIFDEL